MNMLNETTSDLRRLREQLRIRQQLLPPAARHGRAGERIDRALRELDLAIELLLEHSQGMLLTGRLQPGNDAGTLPYGGAFRWGH